MKHSFFQLLFISCVTFACGAMEAPPLADKPAAAAKGPKAEEILAEQMRGLDMLLSTVDLLKIYCLKGNTVGLKKCLRTNPRLSDQEKHHLLSLTSYTNNDLVTMVLWNAGFRFEDQFKANELLLALKCGSEKVIAFFAEHDDVRKLYNNLGETRQLVMGFGAFQAKSSVPPVSEITYDWVDTNIFAETLWKAGLRFLTENEAKELQSGSEKAKKLFDENDEERFLKHTWIVQHSVILDLIKERHKEQKARHEAFLKNWIEKGCGP